MARPSTDRREFLQKVGATAGVAVLAGCTGGDEETTETQTTTTEDTGGGGETTTDDSDDDDSGDSEPTSLVYSRANFIAHTDPHGPSPGNDEVKVFTSIYDQLTMFEPGSTALMAGLAEEWEIDETTVTFTLREGVTFHDGAEFTADDVVATYRRYIDEEYEYYVGEDVNSYNQFSFGAVESISAEGDYELVLELGQQLAPILRNLAMWSASILSREAIEAGQDYESDPVGTGPFSVAEIDDGNERVRLAANDDWWGEGPHVDEVVFNTIDSNSTRVQSLLNGESHIIDGLTPSTAGQVEGGSGVELRRKVGGNVGNMAMNLATKEEFRDRNVRKALFHAIDVNSILENVYSGYAERATQPLPPTMLGHNEDIEPYAYDPEQAQSFLDDSEYPDGFSLELSVFQNPRTYHPAPIQTAEVVRSNLAEIGIEVEINQMPFGSWLTYVIEGQHEAALAGWVTDNADPDNIIYQLLDPGIPREDLPEDQNWVSRDHDLFQTYNMVSWLDMEFIDLVREARTTYDEDTRESLYNEASQIAHDRGPWVHFAHVEQLRGVSNGVSNYNVTAVLDPNLQTVTLES